MHKREISHPHKRLQHLAGRYLLPQLFENFPLKLITLQTQGNHSWPMKHIIFPFRMQVIMLLQL